MSDIITEWQDPPQRITLAQDEVHVWRVSLEQQPALIHHLRSLLSAAEIAKADRFYFERDRLRYTVAHSALRMLLARYLNMELAAAKHLQFVHNEYGKPALADPALSSKLDFNLSHSRDLALIAFTCARQVGVDVEYMRADLSHEELAERFFSPQENALLQALPLSIKQAAFYHCWTCKEAYIKARGLGLSLPLDSFDVSVHPEEPAKLLASREDGHEGMQWAMYTLRPAAGYAGALVVEGGIDRLRCWQFTIE